jgi:hypothetical protein
MQQQTVLTLMLFALAAGPVGAGVDLGKIERRITKEPGYQSRTPKYCLLVFGPEALARVWVVQDGETLYVDRNGNGDLTEEGEKFPGAAAECEISAKAGVAPKTKVEVRAATDSTPRIYCEAEGRLSQRAGRDGQGDLAFAARPQDAPIIHFQGAVSLSPDEPYTIQRGDEPTEFYVFLGTPGLGKGTFACMSYKDVPEDVHPVAEVEFPAKSAGGPAIRVSVTMDRRC